MGAVVGETFSGEVAAGINGCTMKTSMVNLCLGFERWKVMRWQSVIDAYVCCNVLARNYLIKIKIQGINK